jgi:hypothetical protein
MLSKLEERLAPKSIGMGRPARRRVRRMNAKEFGVTPGMRSARLGRSSGETTRLFELPRPCHILRLLDGMENTQ